MLTKYYSHTRYPGVYFPKGYSEKETNEAFEATEKIIEFIKENMFKNNIS